MDSVQLSINSSNSLLDINEKTVANAMNSYLCSANYFRHVIPLSMFYIVHNRIDYDPKHYVKANIKNWEYVILDKTNPHDELTNLYGWAYSAMEALQKGCLSQLFLKIIDNNETVEYYRYSFLYRENLTTTKPKGSRKEILTITGKFFENFSALCEFSKVPSTARLSVEIVLTESPRSFNLINYTEADKSDVYSPDKEAVKNLVYVGGLNTNYHHVKAYSKIKSLTTCAASSHSGCSEVIEILEDDSMEALNNRELNQIDVCNKAASVRTDNGLYTNTSEHNLPKGIKSLANHAEKNQITHEKEPSSIQGVFTKSPTAYPSDTYVEPSEFLAQKIKSCKKKQAKKGKDRIETIFGDTTVEAIEPENAASSDDFVSLHEITMPYPEMKTNKPVKKIKLKSNYSQNNTLIEANQKSVLHNNNEVIKESKKGQRNVVEIIRDMTLSVIEPEITNPSNITFNLSRNRIFNNTPSSELYLNNDLISKAMRKAEKISKSDPNIAKKSKTKTGDLSIPTPSLHGSDINDSIFANSTIELEKLSPIAAELVQVTLGKEPEKAPTKYIDHITSLTPKKSKRKRKNTESSPNKVFKKAKAAHTNNQLEETEKPKLKNKNESVPKLPKKKITESYDSTILETEVVKKSIVVRQPLIESTQLGGSNSNELNPDVTAGIISVNKTKQTYLEEDALSISSTETDRRYIQNRLRFG